MLNLSVCQYDLGWSMGEHNEWSKYSNFDVSLRVPFIISVPKSDTLFKHIKPSKRFGKSYKKKTIKEFIELVDVFPTLIDLAGLPPLPICHQKTTQLVCTEGLSVKPLISKNLKKRPKWKSFVFSQYPRPSLQPQQNSDQPILKDIKIMGYTMKGHYLRYTEWIAFDSKTLTQNWSQVFARELYFGRQQNYNFAEEKSLTILTNYLSDILRKGWRHQLAINNSTLN